MLPCVTHTFVEPTPAAILGDLRKHYRSLKSFSMTVQHFGNSGTFPGSYTQTFQCKGKRFEMKVSIPNRDKKTATTQNRAPDYFCDGTIVWSKWPGRLLSEHSALNRNPNVTPGYEECGGPIFSWIFNTPQAEGFVRPPANLKLTARLGPVIEWNHLVVQPIIMSNPKVKDVTMTMFVSIDHTRLMGFEWGNHRKFGASIYLNQVENSQIPATLGKWAR